MKKITKSLLAVVLSIILMSMLPISAMADPVQASFTYNAEYFVEFGKRSSDTLPEYLYNGTTVEGLGYSVSITGENDSAEEGVKQVYNFTFDATAMEIKTPDVLEITTAPKTVTLSGEKSMKYIGILANTSESTAISADITLNFKDTTVAPKVLEDVTINSMFTQSAKSEELGKAVYTTSTGSSKQYNKESDDHLLYLNLVELITDTTSKIDSITFGTAPNNKPYHIIGIVEVPYTDEEKQKIEDQVTQIYLPIYKEKSLDEIVDEDYSKIESVLTALKETDEGYEHIYNLYTGYPLYTAQLDVKAEYDAIMITRNYLTATKEDIYENQEEASNLDALLAVYDKQTAIEDKKEELQGILGFFGIADDIFVDITEKETISKLKQDYLNYKEAKALEVKIAELFAKYSDKKISDITSGNIAELDELIESYNKADKVGFSYDAEERKHIEDLRNYYVNAQNSEKNYHYDLTNYFNRGMIASVGDSVSSDWGSNSTTKVDGTSYKTGVDASKWKASATDGIVKVTGQINYKGENAYAAVPELELIKTPDRDYTFKISDATKATDKNVIVTTTKDSSPVTIKGSGRMSQHLDFLVLAGESSGIVGFNADITYTDGTKQTQLIRVPWNGYNNGSVGSYPGTSQLYSYNGVAKTGSNKFLFRAYTVKLTEGKIIDTIALSGSSQVYAPIVAISEHVISNDKFKSYLIDQYNVVKDYDETTFDVKEATKFSDYCKEAHNRGIQLSSVKDGSGNPVFDMELAESISKKVLTAEASFEKTDMDKVRATVKFTQPVNEADVIANLKLQKKGADDKYEDIKDYTFEMVDEKTAVIEFADKFFGGVEYKLVILGDLPLKEYPTYKISKAYEFSYISPAYIEFNAKNKFEKLDKDTFKSTIEFSQPVNKDMLKDSIIVTKSDVAFSDFKVNVIDDKTVEVTVKDEPLGGVKYKIKVSEELKLKDYPEYNIPNIEAFEYSSLKYIEPTLSSDKKTLTVKNNTSTSYSYVVVMTEIAGDNTKVLNNIQISSTVGGLDTNTHSLSVEATDSTLYISIWNNKQNPLFAVSGEIKATESATDKTADYMKPTLDEKNVLKIAGFTPSKEKGKNITLDILRNDSSFMKKQVLTNKDGYFEILVALNDSLISEGSTLSFTLGGDDFNKKVSLENVYYAVKAQKQGAIDTIINPASTADDIETLLKSEEIFNINILSLDADVYKNIDLEKASELILAKKALFSTTDDNALKNSIKLLRQLLIVSAFNQDKKDVIAKDGYLLYEDVMDYASIDASNVTIYNLYKTAVSEEGRNKLVDFLLAQEEYTDASEIVSKMIEKMFLLELEYPAKSGTGYVSDVLTTPNTAKVGLSIQKYFAFGDKSGINKAIAEAAINTKSDITSVVDTYYANNYNGGSDGSGNSGGGFSSGSSSVGSFGADQPYLDSIANQNGTANSGTVFKDVSKDHWAHNYILELYDKNILSGKGNDTFAPEDGLTRAELVKIIVAAKNLKPNGAAIPFVDVSADSWYLPYVQAAYSNGIISGVTDTSFAPDQKISRQDLCVVLYRLLADKSAGEINFNDSSNIAPYAQDAVKCFVNMGIINGFEDGSFRPNDGCTRAQCAKIISMFLQK